MPFTPRTFQPIGGQSFRGGSGSAVTVPGAPQVFSYRTDDATTVVDAAGYFNAVRQLLEIGDMIYRVTINGSGVVQTAGLHVVMTKSATAVDTSDTLALTVANTRV
jgi:hypothetical protein